MFKIFFDYYFEKLANRHAPQVAAVLSILVFIPVVWFGFSNYDDNIYLTSNTFVKNLTLTNVSYLFTHQFYGHYFPVTLLFSSFQYFFFGQWAGGYHLVNLLVHIFNIFLLQAVFSKLNIRPSIVFFALLVFAIHPLQVETVAWLGATNNLLFVFFVFSGLYSYLLVVQNKQNEFYFFSLLLYLLACLSKSSAVIFPLLLLLVDFYLKGKLTLKDVLLKLPFFALSILFGLISIKAAQHFGSVEPVLNVYTWYNIPVVVAQQMAFYIIKLFVPIGLKIRYNNPQEINGILPVWSYFSIVVLAVLSWAGFYFRKNKTWWFGLLWFLFGVVLVLKIRYSTNVYAADRYAYLVLPGLVVFLSEIFEKIKHQNFTRYFIVLYFVGIIVITGQRLHVWKSSTNLFQNLVENAEGDSKPFLFRGLNFIKENQFDAAIKDLKTAQAIEPQNPKNINALATAYMLNNKPDSAEFYFLRAIKIDSTLANPYFHLGSLYGQQENYQLATFYFNKHLKLNPNHGETYYWLGNIQVINTNYSEAIKLFNLAEKNYTTKPELYLNKGYCFIQLNETAQACTNFITAKKMGYEGVNKLLQKHCY